MKLPELIADFDGLDDHEKLELLVELSDELPPTSAGHSAGQQSETCRVQECQTPVYLWIGVRAGKVNLHADVPRESPTVRGFVALLLKTLDGLSPAEVAAVPGDLLDQMQLTETLGMMRTQGLTSILGRIKRSVANPALQDASPST